MFSFSIGKYIPVPSLKVRTFGKKEKNGTVVHKLDVLYELYQTF